ncbi:MAG: PLP-dependent cysteine synthase family protein [Oligoflexia bacterium]|nr:PLP-dependent cysteine synthase family protein [Oligoflexia bacterium]
MQPREWINTAVRIIEADFNRSADTHLVPYPLPAFPKIHLYFKDESSHPTGSLKHRLARSLFLYGLCNGWIHERTTLVEASSGSTAISEAYFARLLGLPFIAVMPKSTSPEKISQIEFYGGKCHLIDDPTAVYDESRRLATQCKGLFLDQFTYAERATDWRSNNNLAESILSQMQSEVHPIPRWIVCGAGTGGTSATLGRYIRYRRLDCGVCVVDPENSVFFDYFVSGNCELRCARGSRIEGIGRPRVERSFLRDVVDLMVRVPDAASIAATRYLSQVLGRQCGGSTGTNFYGALQLIADMHAEGSEGSIVVVLCDGGQRYQHTYFCDSWLAQQGIDITPHYQAIQRFVELGVKPSWSGERSPSCCLSAASR